MIMMKKFIAVFLSVVMMTCSFSFTSFAASKVKTPSAPTSLSASATTSAVTLKWKKVKKVDGYTVYKYDSKNKKSSKTAETKKTTYKISKLSSGTKYVYYVKAYVKKGKKKIYSKASKKLTVTTKFTAPAVPTSLSSISTTTTVTLKWKSVKKTAGYTIYRYNPKGKKSTALADTKDTSYKINNLASGTTYVYYIKAFAKNGKTKVYSKASSKLTVSTLTAAVSGFKVNAADFSSVTLYWTKVKNATSYKIQYSADKSFKNGVQTTTTSSTTKTITPLTENKTYYFRIYACRTVNNKTYTSAVSPVISAKTLVPARLSAVDETKTYQTIEGFGASGAWWAQKVGGWENADEYLKLLYSKTDGIGLNIYRYNLGAGTENDDKIDHGKSAVNFIESVDGTKDDNGYWQNDYKINYDWSKDANAQNALALAKKYAGDDLNVVLFANSAPVEFTQNSKGYCSYHKESENYKMNLARENFSIYADYITSCADYFVEQGYNIVDVSPVNEPQYEWSCDENGAMSQEGSYFTPKTLKSLYSKMIDAAKNKPYKISMFESGSAEGAQTTFSNYLTNIMADTNNKNYFHSVSVHSYWSDKIAKQDCYDFLKSEFPNLSIACTEYCQMTNDSNTGVMDIQSALEGFAYNGTTIDFGVQMARVINEDMTILNATQWNWWTAVSGGYYPDGLIYYNGPAMTDDEVWGASSKELFTSKRLWCLGNYSKFIDIGAKRVQVTEAQNNLLSSAYKNPDGSLIIVYVNQQNQNMRVNVNAQGYKNYKTYVTSSSQDLELNQQGTYNIKNDISIPAQSVVTLELTK